MAGWTGVLISLALHAAAITRKRRVVGCLHLFKKTERLFARFLLSRVFHLLYHRQTNLTNRVFRQMHAYGRWTIAFDQSTNLRHCLSHILVPRVR